LHASQFVTDTQSRRIGLAIALALHVAVIAALLTFHPAQQAILTTVPVIMAFIIASAVEKPAQPPKPLPVRSAPRPMPPRPVEPAPPMTITAEAPAHVEAPIAEVAKPLPSVHEAAVSPPAAELPTTPPSFNAAYLDNPPPNYPPLARRSGEQGRVLLRVLVTPGGVAETVELRTSSGSSRLDNAALEVVKRWRFVPARRGDQPVAAWVLVPINFTLEN
jgi:protein TonB